MFEFLSQSPGPLRSLLDFLYPSLCSGCGQYDDSSVGLCALCQKSILRFPYPICLSCEELIDDKSECSFCCEDGFPLFSYGVYDGPLRKAVVSFKYQGVIRICSLIAEKISETFAKNISSLEANILIPIPLHPSREYSRGYNQASLFAIELASRLDLSVDETILIRVKKGIPQAKILGSAKRRSNIAGVFSTTNNSDLSAKVILVDDVVTTGSTVTEAKRMLTLAGFQVVATISMAHGPIYSGPAGPIDDNARYLPGGGK